MMKKIFSILLLICILTLCCTSCENKDDSTPAEKLSQVYEMTKEYEVVCKQKPQNTIEEQAREQRKGELRDQATSLMKELGLYSPYDNQHNAINMTKNDLEEFFLSHSLEELLWIFEALYNIFSDFLVPPQELLDICQEIYPEAFVFFSDYSKNSEGYYTQTSTPAVRDRTETSNTGAPDTICTAEYYGDFAIEKRDFYLYSDGELGWNNGVFVDAPGGYRRYTVFVLYYKDFYLNYIDENENLSNVFIVNCENEIYLFTTEKYGRSVSSSSKNNT